MIDCPPDAGMCAHRAFLRNGGTLVNEPNLESPPPELQPPSALSLVPVIGSVVLL